MSNVIAKSHQDHQGLQSEQLQYEPYWHFKSFRLQQ